MKQVIKVPNLPERPAAGHKGTFGTVALLAGSPGMFGAAILCARGALRGGAGLCRACLPEELMAPFTVAVPAATTLRRTPQLTDFFQGMTSAVVGPGLGTSRVAGEQVLQILSETPGPVVFDADALNLLAPLETRLIASAPLVLTPHPGEAGRLLGRSSSDVQQDRLSAVEELSKRSGQIVVLKGHETLVCDGTRVYRNRTGNSGLATGGSGDVLAGLLGALLGQAIDPFDAACIGVFLHGKAGDLVASRLSPAGMTAEDLPLAIAEVMR